MSDSPIKIDVARWVERARADPAIYRRRKGVQIILNALASKAPLNKKMFLKGGMLMGLAYDSPRQTVDIDLTTILEARDGADEWIRDLLNQELPRVASQLNYADLMVAAQSAKWQQRVRLEAAEFPALRIHVAYALRGTRQEKALQRGQASNIIKIDISFNERMGQIQILELPGFESCFARVSGFYEGLPWTGSASA